MAASAPEGTASSLCAARESAPRLVQREERRSDERKGVRSTSAVETALPACTYGTVVPRGESPNRALTAWKIETET